MCTAFRMIFVTVFSMFKEIKGKGLKHDMYWRLGLVRAEYAVDHNSGTGALFFRFGERF